MFFATPNGTHIIKQCAICILTKWCVKGKTIELVPSLELTPQALFVFLASSTVIGYCTSGVFMARVSGQSNFVTTLQHPEMSKDVLLYVDDVVCM